MGHDFCVFRGLGGAFGCSVVQCLGCVVVVCAFKAVWSFEGYFSGLHCDLAVIQAEGDSVGAWLDGVL
jgi:hypothetical protein